ncbi:hypothetical protein BLNAU_20892 [Blattamonas nauphoetae]|uniref:Uncharacterized protein n=1 Tax=Blattamonas nauphoetae TaxID=2049346 RepID=A0ABQ9WXF0_9EUKA|nr:hypothetical protein BLNAU_20892 [Blattamonas nauphoetae]
MTKNRQRIIRKYHTSILRHGIGEHWLEEERRHSNEEHQNRKDIEEGREEENQKQRKKDNGNGRRVKEVNAHIDTLETLSRVFEPHPSLPTLFSTSAAIIHRQTISSKTEWACPSISATKDNEEFKFKTGSTEEGRFHCFNLQYPNTTIIPNPKETQKQVSKTDKEQMNDTHFEIQDPLILLQ